MKRMRSILIGAVCWGLLIGSATATPLNLVTGLSQSVVTGGSVLLDIAAMNQAPGDITDVNAFLLAFQLLPQSGATGTLTITTAGQPATNALLTGPELPYVFFQPSGSLAPGSVNGSSSFVGVVMANEDPDLGDTLAADATANLISLTLTASANASGTWTLYAITNGNPISAWQSTDSVADIAFGNLLIPENGSISSLQLGTVSVAPVPEPEDMLFPAAIGLVVVGAGKIRRFRFPHTWLTIPSS